MHIRRLPAAIIPTLFVFFLLVLPSKSTAANQFTISGSGYAAPLGTHPLTTVNVYDKTTMTLLGSTTTNVNGNYLVDFYPVGVGNHKQTGLYGTILRNPYQEKLEIALSTKESGSYNLQITDAAGSNLLSKSILLQSGSSTLALTGLGAAGLKTIQISGYGQKLTFKAIQGTSGAFSASVDIIHTDVSKLKISATADSLLVSFVPPSGYNGMDITVNIQSQIVDYVLQQTPIAINFTLKTFLETGEAITLVNPTFTITIDWDDSTIVYPVVNGQININRNYYPLNPPDLGTVWIYNDTSITTIGGVANGVLNWSIIRQPKQVTNRPNVAQNETTAGALIPDFKTKVPLDSLNNKTQFYYTIRRVAETSSGQYYPLDDGLSITLIGESGGGMGAGTFIDLKPFNVADSLDIVLKGFNESSGNPMPQSDLERAMSLFLLAVQTRYLPNGDTLLPPHRIYTIASYNDPRWQALITRGFDNSIMSTYYNGDPQISREFQTTYTYNEKFRIKTAGARYNDGNNDAQIFTEDFSAVTGEEEISGGMSWAVWNVTTNQPSQYAKSISAIPALLNLGTGQ